MRAFVQSRSLADTHKDVAEKITAREKKYDGIVLEAIRDLLQPAVGRPRPIGFVTPRERTKSLRLIDRGPTDNFVNAFVTILFRRSLV